MSLPCESQPMGTKRLLSYIERGELDVFLQLLANDTGTAFVKGTGDGLDLLTMARDVTVVNPRYVGKETWDEFCEYLEDVHDDSIEYPIIDEAGRVVAMTPIIEDDLLLVVGQEDSPLPHGWREPNKPSGSIRFATASDVGGILATVLQALTH